MIESNVFIISVERERWMNHNNNKGFRNDDESTASLMIVSPGGPLSVEEEEKQKKGVRSKHPARDTTWQVHTYTQHLSTYLPSPGNNHIHNLGPPAVIVFSFGVSVRAVFFFSYSFGGITTKSEKKKKRKVMVFSRRGAAAAKPWRRAVCLTSAYTYSNLFESKL